MYIILIRIILYHIYNILYVNWKPFPPLFFSRLCKADIVKDLTRLKFRKFGDTTPPRSAKDWDVSLERKSHLQNFCKCITPWWHNSKVWLTWPQDWLWASLMHIRYELAWQACKICLVWSSFVHAKDTASLAAGTCWECRFSHWPVKESSNLRSLSTF